MSETPAMAAPMALAEGLVDIHCHALPQVDDGAASLEMGLEMLRRARGEGVRDVVLTPHFRPDDGLARAGQIQQRFAEFADAAAAADLGLRLHLGAELGFRFGLVELARATATARLAGGPYVLVDLPPGLLSPGLEQAFFELRAAGLRPVLAHPERHRDLAQDLGRVVRLREQELLVQVDAGSLGGRFGRRAQAAAVGLVEQGRADFVGSDGHDLDSRPLSLRRAYDQVAALVGQAAARRLFADNPRRVLTGETVEAVAPVAPSPGNASPGDGRGPWRRLRRLLARA